MCIFHGSYQVVIIYSVFRPFFPELHAFPQVSHKGWQTRPIFPKILQNYFHGVCHTVLISPASYILRIQCPALNTDSGVNIYQKLIQGGGDLWKRGNYKFEGVILGQMQTWKGSLHLLIFKYLTDSDVQGGKSLVCLVSNQP